ncbi:MAG TPA: hypothetical protein VKA49_14905 [Flavitalea sp.]|nr:hypothetical protein [Flavitalea sp.]
MTPDSRKLLLSIALLSAAIISFQLALIQIISNVQWYHFAYMVISMALLGFGAAGTVLAIFREKLVNNTQTLLPVLMIGTGISMALVTDICQAPFVRFDSYLLFAEYAHIGRLVFTYLLYFVPFFIGALAIGLVFVRHVDEIGKVYFSNLVGSGIGSFVAVLLIWLFLPKEIPACIAILPIIGALMILPKNKRVLHIAFALIGVSIITWKFMQPPNLILSEYKDLSKTLLLPGAKIIAEKTSPYGVVQMVSSPALRYAPGLSLTAQTTAQIKMAAFVNGDWFGAVTDWKRTDTSMILDYTTSALPYIMAKRNRVLVLQVGTGVDIAHALSQGVKTVVAVESNPVIVSLLQGQFAGETDSLFLRPNVSVHNLEPRTFLSLDESRFDLIALPIVGSLGGSSGLAAMQEKFILTKEAFNEMWLHLNPGGVISVSSWMDYPVRNPLKILATIVEVLQESGVTNPKDHIAAIRSWGTITFVISRSEIQANHVDEIRKFCDEMMFDPAILPQLNVEERTRYNQFQDNRFFDYVDRILSPGREAFYADYDFNIKPATDNRPYFSQYIKWSNLKRLSQFFGNRSIPFFEIGYVLVILTLFQISIMSLVLIFLPLFKIGWKGKSKGTIILYFSGIGLGYMFVEMVFIQRFILYFGNPVYSASAVITALLAFSGLGSYYSNYILKRRKGLKIIFSVIVSILIIYSFILTPILQQTVHLNLFFKSLIVFLIAAPLAFCMGVPFPAGLSYISMRDSKAVPWAWGINGCVSVISTALATIIAVEMGFTWVMLFATVAYSLPLLVQMTWNRHSG